MEHSDLCSEEEWMEQVQTILQANSGINFKQFFQYLELNMKEELRKMPQEMVTSAAAQRLKFHLKCIFEVYQEFSQYPFFLHLLTTNQINTSSFLQLPSSL